MDADAAQLLWKQRRYSEILGVCPLASADEIKKARRVLQLIHHSDKGSDGVVSAIVNQACDALLQGVAGDCELRWATAFPGEPRPNWAATHEMGIGNLRSEKRRVEQSVAFGNRKIGEYGRNLLTATAKQRVMLSDAIEANRKMLELDAQRLTDAEQGLARVSDDYIKRLKQHRDQKEGVRKQRLEEEEAHKQRLEEQRERQAELQAGQIVLKQPVKQPVKQPDIVISQQVATRYRDELRRSPPAFFKSGQPLAEEDIAERRRKLVEYCAALRASNKRPRLGKLARELQEAPASGAGGS